ncbi:hypothetical protein ASPZODRAFT_1937166 [Penicilliopsis zonata CBS 506.65]|uniref:Arabinan endo-1,5-alpha-L-arabinosidase n=1 Tax=Penicilliopsis zonata CBS 506.65 TaxID=1073090 RepID=A0A1L9SJG2_9EURO|nr:hypothetical protein ASPZODRAFT_1937166 [Penicilliopsis zonata CBS 506.65]OJJ47295.1 hypothetical protein ASPZODRAFT_1937166 [Penicilliopsis zonata CBS 506.65]
MGEKIMKDHGHLSAMYAPLSPQGQEPLSGSFWSPRFASNPKFRHYRRVIKMLLAVALLSYVAITVGLGIPHRGPNAASSFPATHATNLQTHDPSIIKHGDTYYLYAVGEHISIFNAPTLDGPWTQSGTVLKDLSVIPKGDREKPWAPMVLEHDGKFYCYYSVSEAGCRDSAIGVATSDSPGAGSWVDHGIIVQSGTGDGSGSYPFNTSNTIDPAAFIDGSGQAYLTFGSYWTGIWEVPLNPDLLTADVSSANSRHLAYEPVAIDNGGDNPNPLCRDGSHPEEGSFMSYHEPWYYLWFSHGKCCDLDPNALPAAGQEYSIRVGRSNSPQGPFVDQNGDNLVDGGGLVVYGSNGDVYAPGGQGVLADSDSDILYYHYREFRPSILLVWGLRS